MEKKEAMKILKEFRDKSALFSVRTALDTVIPELKESEDERIRKEILNVFKQLDKDSTICGRNYDYAKWIAWLEKQGDQSHWKPTEEQLQTLHAQLNEGVVTYPDDKCVLTTLYEDLMKITSQEEKQNWQKPADKVEPKFKVGDWILYSGDHYEGVRYITKINEKGYYIERNGLPHGIIPFNHEICMRLWTIQDAEDGDVLVESNCNAIIMFRGVGNIKRDDVIYYHFYYNCHWKDFIVQEGGSHWCNITDCTLSPATKEQRDILFQKMKESGYEWDAENKELKKIEQNLD